MNGFGEIVQNGRFWATMANFEPFQAHKGRRPFKSYSPNGEYERRRREGPGSRCGGGPRLLLNLQ